MKPAFGVLDEVGRGKVFDRLEQLFRRLDCMLLLPKMIEERRLVDLLVCGNVPPEFALLEVLVFESLGFGGRLLVNDFGHDAILTARKSRRARRASREPWSSSCAPCPGRPSGVKGVRRDARSNAS